MTRDELEAEYRARRHRDPWRYIPHGPTPRQRAFLALQHDEALFGGAAGGGKSDALLMAALRHVDVPGYSAILFRRTFADLALPGAVMDRSHTWLANTDAHWSGLDRRWTFPSGATIQFGYLDNDRDRFRYQSAEFIFCGFDELTQFGEGGYRYLQSRLRRRAGFPIKPHSRAASNPGGIGHDWVHARFVGPEAEFPFVPSTLSDNPHVDADDYRQRLERLDSTTRAQLLDGVWLRDGSGQLYRLDEARNVIDDPPPHDLELVLAVDLGSSELTPTTAYCIAGFSWTEPHSVWVLESAKWAGATPRSIADEIQRLGGDRRFYEIIVDQGGLGKAYIREFREHYGIDARDVQKQNKLGFRKMLNGALEHGDLKIVRAANADLLAEMRNLQWNTTGTDAEPGKPDHLTDAMLYAWRHCKAHLATAPTQKTRVETDEEKNRWAEEQMIKERERGLARQGTAWWAL